MFKKTMPRGRISKDGLNTRLVDTTKMDRARRINEKERRVCDQKKDKLLSEHLINLRKIAAVTREIKNDYGELQKNADAIRKTSAFSGKLPVEAVRINNSVANGKYRRSRSAGLCRGERSAKTISADIDSTKLPNGRCVSLSSSNVVSTKTKTRRVVSAGADRTDRSDVTDGRSLIIQKVTNREDAPPRNAIRDSRPRAHRVTSGKGVASSKKRWCPVGQLSNQLGVRGAL